MEQEKKGPNGLGVFAGCLLGMVLALWLPATMLTELTALLPMVMLPSIALIALRRISGRIAAIMSGAMQLVVAGATMGAGFMGMYFFMAILPVLVVLRMEKKPFAEQIQASIAAFGGGAVLSVLIFYILYGSDVVGRLFSIFSESIRSLPEAMLALVKDSFSALEVQSMTAEEFYEAFDRMLELLSGSYRVNLPGLIFSGALVSAVGCTALNGRMRTRRKLAEKGEYYPMIRWSLPPSAVGGLLMILAISYLMMSAGMTGGEAAFHAVYDISAAAFGIQGLASLSRRMEVFKTKGVLRGVILTLTAAAALLGAEIYLAIYGLISALVGSRGVLWRTVVMKMNDALDDVPDEEKLKDEAPDVASDEAPDVASDEAPKDEPSDQKKD